MNEVKKAHPYSEKEIQVEVNGQSYKLEDGTLYVARVGVFKEELCIRWHIARTLAGCSTMDFLKATKLLTL